MSEEREGSSQCREILETQQPQKASFLELMSKNKPLPGFENPGRSIYTCVRELVDNAFDSAESISRTPFVEISIDEVDDDEEEVAESSSCKTRAAKKPGVTEGKRGALGKKGKAFVAPKDKTYILTCKDNGSGIQQGHLDEIFGRAPCGTKFDMKQRRGQNGCGITMVFLWSLKSVGNAIEIVSSTSESDTSFYRLDPVRFDGKHLGQFELTKTDSKGSVSGELWSSGTKIQISIKGNYEDAKVKILDYFLLLTICTPYSRIIFTACVKPADGGPPVESDTFDSEIYGTSEMPSLPSLIKPHPSRVDVTHLKLRLAKTQERTLFKFLQSEFAGIDDSVAKKLYVKLGKGVGPDTPIEWLKRNARRFYDQLGKIRFKGLRDDVLSPIGEAALSSGVKHFLKGELQMFEFFSGSVQEYGGNPFIVEVLVILGGLSLKGLTVISFANRRLLHQDEKNDDCIIRAAKEVRWKYYEVDLTNTEVVVVVSIVSTSIPYKTFTKDSIADVSEISCAVKMAIEKCCGKLQKKIKIRYKEEKSNDLVNVHFPDCAELMMSIIEQSEVRLAQKNGKDESSESGDLQKLYADNKYTKDNLVAMLSDIHTRVGTAPEDASEQSHQGTAHVDFMEGGGGEGEGEGGRRNKRRRTDKR